MDFLPAKIIRLSVRGSRTGLAGEEAEGLLEMGDWG